MMRTDFFNKQATLVSERQRYRCYIFGNPPFISSEGFLFNVITENLYTFFFQIQKLWRGNLCSDVNHE